MYTCIISCVHKVNDVNCRFICEKNNERKTYEYDSTNIPNFYIYFHVSKDITASMKENSLFQFLILGC